MGRKSSKPRYHAARPLVLGRARVSQAAGPARRWVRWVQVGICSVLTLVAGLALWLTIDDRFYILDLDVTGNARTPDGVVGQASEIAGLHIFWVRSDEVSERIVQAVPGIEAADVVCRLPAACTIQVIERQPKVTWIDAEQGASWWVDDEGVVFPAAGVDSEGWAVRGPLPVDEDGRLQESMRAALAELWAADNNVPQSFDYVPGRGLTFNDPRGWQVVLGTGSGMMQRMQVLDLLTARLAARGVSPKYVDVRFPEAPYYSITNEW